MQFHWQVSRPLGGKPANGKEGTFHSAEGYAASVEHLNHPIVTGPVPLMPGQHWFLDSEPENPHFWNIAMMLEIDQPVDPVLFAEAIGHVLVHHDVLWARFVREPDGWRQLFALPETDPLPFAFFDFTAPAESEQRAAVETECAQLRSSLNITSRPVIRIALCEKIRSLPKREMFLNYHGRTQRCISHPVPKLRQQPSQTGILHKVQ